MSIWYLRDVAGDNGLFQGDPGVARLTKQLSLDIRCKVAIEVVILAIKH